MTLSRFLKPGREQKVSVRISSSSAISSSSQTPVGDISYSGKENNSKEHYPERQVEEDKIAHDRVDHRQPRVREWREMENQ